MSSSFASARRRALTAVLGLFVAMGTGVVGVAATPSPVATLPPGISSAATAQSQLNA